MKILIFTKEYNHKKVGIAGGTGVFYRNLATELNARNHEVFVFGSSKSAVTFDENGIKHYFVKHYFKKNKIAEFLRSTSGKLKFLQRFQIKFYEAENKYLTVNLEKFIQDHKLTFDLIETHDWDGTSLFLEQLKIPYTVRYHGSWTILQKYFGYKKIPSGKIECEKKAAKRSKNNITISKYSERINKESFHLKNPFLIYNGIDHNYFSPEKDSKIISKSIFYLGNLSTEKGADVALEAFAKIKKQIPDATLHFIGKENDYQNKVAKDLSKDVVFYGRKNSDEIKLLINQAEIVLFPSKGETFGLSLLEVMALKKAVICSSIAAFQEIITNNENGMIAENVGEFTEKSIFLFQNKDFREKLESNARKTVVEKFGIEKQMQETLKYYQEVVTVNN